MLRFPYQDEVLLGPAPPTLAASATNRYRPLVPITFLGAQDQSIHFGRALVDPGADDTILPYDLVTILGVETARFIRAEFYFQPTMNSPQTTMKAGPFTGADRCL